MKNLSLRAKLLLISGFMSTICLAVGLTSFWYTTKITNAFSDIIKADVPSIRQINQMVLSFRLARIELLNLIVPGRSAEENETSIKMGTEQWEKFFIDEKAFLEGSAGAKEKEIFNAFKEATDVGHQDFKHAVELFEKNKSETSAERKEMERFVVNELDQHGKVVRETAQKVVDYSSAALEENTEHAFSAAKTGTTVSLAITLIGAIFGFLFCFIFSKRLAQQISTIIASISESSIQVSAASGHIAASSQQLSQAATEQASALEQTASSLEEISAMVSKASDNAEATARTSVESQQKAEEGRTAADQMMTSMDEINQSNEAIMVQVNQSNARMSEIVKVIQEIGNKTNVINEIVFQTKLLSFNASVEAARAGEHGKGFAVVAEEVGNLAQMSGNAAKEITGMLAGSISKVEQMVNETKSKVEGLIEQGHQKVTSGMNTARQCAEVLNEIVHNVSKVATLSQEISVATKEQAQGIGEINKAMNQLDTVTQQNSAASEETSSAAEKLFTQSDSLKNAVSELSSTISGANSKDHTEMTPAFAAPKKSGGNKVAHIKSLKKENVETPRARPELKAISGESFVPDRDDDGFREI